MNKNSFLTFALICISLIALGQKAKDSPKLVVGIVVDQMRYDYLERFQSKFVEDGFMRLINDGFSCENNYLNYVPTNTAPGHASIYTGTTPSVHGIINNSWYNREMDSYIYCVEDSESDPVGTGNKQESHSPKNLLASTFTDHFKKEKQESKVISISLKSRAAVLSGGKKADAAYWFRGKGQGNWISSSYYIDGLPKWVKEFNASDALINYMKPWETLLPINQYTESRVDSNDFERGFRGNEQVSFPYDLESLAKDNGDFDIIKSTPFGNSYTFDFAKKAIEGESLGKNTTTDFLFISLSSTDFVGHNFGVQSKELEDTYLRLDHDIASFLKYLDSSVGSGEYTLFLTSDHGALENANALKAKGVEASYFKEATFISAVREFAFNQWKNATIIKNVSNAQLYIDTNLVSEMGLDITEVQQKVLDFVKLYPKIATVFSKEELLHTEMTTPNGILMKNGYHKERGGDIIYFLEENTLVYAETGSDHGSGYEYDTHVPLLFFGNGIRKGATVTHTYSISVMKTLSDLLGASLPETASKVAIPALTN